jgi:GNAT superfamily N-acetyltransferase
VIGWISRSWGGTVMAVHGELIDVAALPALVALEGEDMIGVLTYRRTGSGIEIVSVDADPPGHHAGRALVSALHGHAGIDHLWCTTTNDNLAALGFWQALGFRLVALRPDAVTAARVHKPAIPFAGEGGLPVRDELDLRLDLPQAV